MNKYICKYVTPPGFDDLFMGSDGDTLSFLLFDNEKLKIESGLQPVEPSFLPVFSETLQWLDEYFNGKIPSFTPPLSVADGSPFFKRVTEILKTIPYGETITYGEIAKIIAAEKNMSKMSAQAVGNAVGKNPVCIIIPCHRVVGANGKLVGFGGGINNKISLLKLEKIKNITL